MKYTSKNYITYKEQISNLVEMKLWSLLVEYLDDEDRTNLYKLTAAELDKPQEQRIGQEINKYERVSLLKFDKSPLNSFETYQIEIHFIELGLLHDISSFKLTFIDKELYTFLCCEIVKKRAKQ